ncbi:hypothetical protein ACFX2B_012914 [Malus domestica]
MFTTGEATAAEAVEEEEAFRFLLTSPSGKQQKKKLGPSGGSMAGEKDLNLHGCGGIGVRGGDDQIFRKVRKKSLTMSKLKAGSLLTSTQRICDMFIALCKDSNGSLTKQELRGYADGTLLRKSEMPKKIKRRPMT